MKPMLKSMKPDYTLLNPIKPSQTPLKLSSVMAVLMFLIWRVPEIGVPPNHHINHIPTIY